MRFNPGDMRDNSEKIEKLILKIARLNRLAIDDSFESGKSITLGASYKRE